jgi:hypothetical protein
MSSYSPSTHTHNFACWTAAAAVRRGFTTNEVIAAAIEKAKLNDWANELIKKHSNFALQHDTKCLEVARALKKHKKLNSSVKEKCTFGRAAKIVAIYLKTYIVISNATKTNHKLLVQTIYPPIDQILLEGIIKKHPKLKSSLKDYKWTKASKAQYHTLRNKLIAADLPFNWELEEYWKGYQSSSED